jgi:hypothetical protein
MASEYATVKGFFILIDDSSRLPSLLRLGPGHVVMLCKNVRAVTIVNSE